MSHRLPVIISTAVAALVLGAGPASAGGVPTVDDVDCPDAVIAALCDVDVERVVVVEDVDAVIVVLADAAGLTVGE